MNNLSGIRPNFTQRPNPGVDPNTYAQQYANQNGISLEEAKEELKAKFGDPEKPTQETKTTTSATTESLDDLDDEGKSIKELIEDVISQNSEGELTLRDLFQMFTDYLKEFLNSDNKPEDKPTIKDLFQNFLNEISGQGGPQKEGDPV